MANYWQRYFPAAKLNEWNPWWGRSASENIDPSTGLPVGKGTDEQAWWKPITPRDQQGMFEGGRIPQQQAWAWLASSALPFLAPTQVGQMINSLGTALPAELKNQYSSLFGTTGPGGEQTGTGPEESKNWGGYEARAGMGDWDKFYSPERLYDLANYFTDLKGRAGAGNTDNADDVALAAGLPSQVLDVFIATLQKAAGWYSSNSRAGRSALEKEVYALMNTSFARPTEAEPESGVSAAEEANYQNLLRMLVTGGRGTTNPWTDIAQTPFGVTGANWRYG